MNKEKKKELAIKLAEALLKKLHGPFVIVKKKGEKWFPIYHVEGGVEYWSWNSKKQAEAALNKILEDPRSHHAETGKYKILEKTWKEV